MLSLLSSSPTPPEGVAGSDGGSGIWLAVDRVGLGEGEGRGRPNAPPNVGAAALEAKAARAGVGREVEWVGLVGCRFDLRYDSVRSDKSDVSIYTVSGRSTSWRAGLVSRGTCLAGDLDSRSIHRLLLDPPHTARVHHAELDRAP